MHDARSKFTATVGSILVLLSLCGCSSARQNPITITPTDEGFIVKDGQQDVMFYQRTHKAFEGKWSRANYIHPLYSLDGDVLTEDFPPDHKHHRGIFWAWHQVWVGDRKIGDNWEARDFVWDVYDARVLDVDSQSKALQVLVNWKSPQYTNSAGDQVPIVREKTTITVHHAADDIRKIDFQIELLALQDNMKIGGSEDAKGYGGFTTRIYLPEKLDFIGPNGPVEPTNLGLKAGPWMDISGKLGKSDKVSGMSILVHKSTPGYPQDWLLRRKGSAQLPIYPGREPVPLSKTKPLVLRYRLILHRGDIKSVDLNKLQAEYNAEPAM